MDLIFLNSGLMQARVHIPAFTKGKDQLSALEVEETCAIANVRIHVERVVWAVRQRYTVLKGTAPNKFHHRKRSRTKTIS